MSQTLYPIGYRTQLVTMDDLRARHEPRMHPEFARRLFPWIRAQNGLIGIGGGWRATGTQPDQPGFAPEGESFHQSQQFPAGSFYAAVDLVARNDDGLLRRVLGLTGSKGNPDASTLRRLLTVAKVHRAPTWAEVPAQGSEQAALWGVHCNVGTPGERGSESWHMQPVELDGWGRWVAAGRPDLRVGYPLPSDPPETVSPEEGTDMKLFDIPPRVDVGQLAAGERRVIELPFGAEYRQVQMAVQVLPIDGPDPDRVTDPGFVRFIPPTVPAGQATHNDVGWQAGDVFRQQLVECNVADSKVVIEVGPAPCRVIIDLKGFVA